MSSNTSEDTGLRIELINQPDDFYHAFDPIANAFGHQAQDGLWIAMNPGWDTLEGKAASAARMVSRWRATTKDDHGNPDVIFLKATLPNPNQGDRVIAGIAIWVQASAVQGHGDPPMENLKESLEVETLFPENEPEQRYVCQAIRSFHKRRNQVIKEKATEAIPAVMILDMCTVDPAYQRKGIATALVQWGLDEAKRRGIPECITEASVMGRHVYAKLGFKPEGPEIEYTVDPEFVDRPRPRNLFMRTGTTA
ncbi:uncharacterized protein N7496_006804 [Penicillium cataractarum]|uniref:N-acetyltransferase domain-containing protein n=1 Tax=Penicillium cataractarum TaxID=2100454 RepID=A0A9W9S2Y6_9EURO|nr:uncharacterized protein N7496_006804 [Penicillium cataractarum]KAJ5370712.1 hypothetical protein N7496_006804 [Penicillium cataractarum]